MYYLKKKLEISASHSLSLDYESKCQSMNGHNWMVTVYCRAMFLNNNGMIVDFSEIKKWVSDVLDHKCLNEVLTINPTAENIARWICEQVPFCYKVKVQETNGNEATYISD